MFSHNRKLAKIKCKRCKKSFNPTVFVQLFCCKQCYQADYADRKRKVKEVTKQEMPVAACQFCGVRTRLNFDPMRDPKSWTDFVCPACGIPRMGLESKGVFNKQFVRNFSSSWRQPHSCLYRYQRYIIECINFCNHLAHNQFPRWDYHLRPTEYF